MRLHNFEGPFDLLLQLIGKHELDITEMALHRVTDDFIAHLTALGDDADLDETTEFLVVAATLLDLKAARLLPDAEVEDAEDGARLLEARDLLFARLLQYRAYKQVAGLFVELEAGRCAGSRARWRWRSGSPRCCPRCCSASTRRAFAELAAAVFRPKPPPTVGVDHLHAPAVSVAEHAALLRGAPRRARRGHVRGADRRLRRPLEVVARFLAVLDLYRERDGRAGAAGGVRRADRTLEPRPRTPDRHPRRMRRVTTTDGPDLGDAPELADPAALDAALEALLLVVDAPTEDDALAAALDQPVARVRAALQRAGRSATPRPAGGSTCATSAAAGGSTPATPTRPTSSGCCSTASAPGSPGPRWRPSPWSPTASR